MIAGIIFCWQDLEFTDGAEGREAAFSAASKYGRYLRDVLQSYWIWNRVLFVHGGIDIGWARNGLGRVCIAYGLSPMADVGLWTVAHGVPITGWVIDGGLANAKRQTATGLGNGRMCSRTRYMHMMGCAA